ncbi:unnamed protein product [Amoebophrya sp. A120]|nr:unnamed protein product [Amoebophrya sp. A120]|eukprot:GSA120T00007934001.1
MLRAALNTLGLLHPEPPAWESVSVAHPSSQNSYLRKFDTPVQNPGIVPDIWNGPSVFMPGAEPTTGGDPYQTDTIRVSIEGLDLQHASSATKTAVFLGAAVLAPSSCSCVRFPLGIVDRGDGTEGQEDEDRIEEHQNYFESDVDRDDHSSQHQTALAGCSGIGDWRRKSRTTREHRELLWRKEETPQPGHTGVWREREQVLI